MGAQTDLMRLATVERQANDGFVPLIAELCEQATHGFREQQVIGRLVVTRREFTSRLHGCRQAGRLHLAANIAAGRVKILPAMMALPTRQSLQQVPGTHMIAKHKSSLPDSLEEHRKHRLHDFFGIELTSQSLSQMASRECDEGRMKVSPNLVFPGAAVCRRRDSQQFGTLGQFSVLA